MDIAKINLEYKKAEQARKVLKTKLQELEERERAYKNNESEKQLLVKHGKILRETLEKANAKIADVKALGDENTLKKSLQEQKHEQNSARARIEETESKCSHALAEWQTQKTLEKTLFENVQVQESELKTSLYENAFANADEARAILLETPASQEKVKAFFEEYTATRLRLAEVDEKKWQDLRENALEEAKEKLLFAQAKVAEQSKELGGLETRLKAMEQTLEKYKALEKEKQEKEKYARLCEQLKALVRSNRFLEYIASEYLQEICARAGKTLLSLTRVLKTLGVVPVPNLRKNRSRAGASIARGLGDIVKSTLKDGGNVIFYPSGHIQTECGCEDIGTRQLAHNICGDLPEKVRVIGVRTTVDIQLKHLAARLAAQQISLEVTSEAKNFIADSGYDPAFGARPLKRAVIRLIETPVSRMIIGGEIQPGNTLFIDVADSALKFSAK